MTIFMLIILYRAILPGFVFGASESGAEAFRHRAKAPLDHRLVGIHEIAQNHVDQSVFHQREEHENRASRHKNVNRLQIYTN